MLRIKIEEGLSTRCFEKVEEELSSILNSDFSRTIETQMAQFSRLSITTLDQVLQTLRENGLGNDHPAVQVRTDYVGAFCLYESVGLGMIVVHLLRA